MRALFRVAFVALLAVVSGCGRQPAVTPAATHPAERTFDARGVVREVASDRRKAVIRHEEIPGYMPRMTMELNIRDPEELSGIEAGDDITFRLHATEETHWIDSIHKVGISTNAPAPPTPAARTEAELRSGDLLPDAELRSETGQSIRLSQFRGRALAFTFFFTRCPLPDFCPRMNKSFQQAREALLNSATAPTNWQFLCISFDTEFDTPSVLVSYATFYRGENRDRWLFAAASPTVLSDLAPRLDLMVAREAGSFSHNLRTVVVDPRGRIHRQFDGNEWTPQQLADAVAAAARQP